MPFGSAALIAAGVAAAGTIGASAISANAAKSAANKQAGAATTAAEQQAAQKQPWVDAGKTGLGQLSTGLAPGGQFTQKFDSSMATNSDAEKMALSEGMGAINNSNAAKSGTLNSNALHEATKFAEGTSAQYQNQAFNQWEQQQQTQLSATESLAGTGLTAVNSSADSTANLMVGGANAQAAGTIGQANAITGGISQLGNLLTTPRVTTPSNTMGSVGINDSQYGGDPYASPGELDSAFSLSDERLKTDKKQVGETKDGTPIYTYRMKGSSKRQMGVMAQDVEKKNPAAVRKHPSGFKMVDYSKVH